MDESQTFKTCEENVLGSINQIYYSIEHFRLRESKRNLTKGELWNAILANLTHPPLRKWVIFFFQNGKGYSVSINWIWDGISLTIQNSTIVPDFLFCRTGHSGILHGYSLVNLLWTSRLQKPLSYFLTLPFPLLLCHAQCSTHFRLLLKKWYTVLIHPLSLQVSGLIGLSKWDSRLWPKSKKS